MKNVDEFLVSPDCGRHHFIVEVHPTWNSYRKSRRLQCTPGRSKAIFRWFGRPRKQGRKTVLGAVVFRLGELTPSVVAHEMFHATVFWAHHIGINPNEPVTSYAQDPEERCARGLDRMVEQFYLKQPKRMYVSCGSRNGSQIVPTKPAA